jgi:hypothetical protein
MSRNGSGVYSKPAGTTAVSGTTIEAAPFNEVIDDIIDDLNLDRPVVAGGTGASTAADARTNLAAAGTADNNTFTGINTYTKIVKWAKGADVASANALTLGDDGNYFDITGTTAITSIGTKGVGTVIKLHFDGALTLTHHATDLILPGGANITTAAGDEAELAEYASGDWRCTSYSRASPDATTSTAGYMSAADKTKLDGVATGADVTPAGAGAFGGALLHIQDQKTAGTAAGTFTSGAWRTRVLNTSLTNEISGASLSSNQITLPSGTYYAVILCPAYSVGTHKAKLVNITDISDALIGITHYSPSGILSYSIIVGRFTIAASKTFEIQHRCVTTQSANGLGFETNGSFTVPYEIYTDVRIWKVA